MKEIITSILIILLGVTILILTFLGKERPATIAFYITMGFLLGTSLPGLLEEIFEKLKKQDGKPKN